MNKYMVNNPHPAQTLEVKHNVAETTFFGQNKNKHKHGKCVGDDSITSPIAFPMQLFVLTSFLTVWTCLTCSSIMHYPN